MAIWTTVDRHEVDGYRDQSAEIIVDKKGRRYRTVFDGPTGLETTIGPFTDVEANWSPTADQAEDCPMTVEFYVNPRSRGRGREQTGSMECNTREMWEFFRDVVEEELTRNN